MNQNVHNTPEQQYLGSIPVWTYGAGSPLVVIHGGPGLDHTYLVDALLPLSRDVRLFFYDQHFRTAAGNGSDICNPTLLVQDLVSLISILSENTPVSILAHSWGAYLAYAALSQLDNRVIDRALLVSPVGLTKDRFDQSGERLIARIPAPALQLIDQLAASGKDMEIINTLFPFYLAVQNRSLGCPIRWYRNAVNECVLAALGDYDFTNIGTRMPARTLIIYGDEDIESPSATIEIQNGSSVQLIHGSGHFSFLEQAESFLTIVKSFMKER